MSEIVQDPVCGMRVHADVALSATFEGREVHFCSELCRTAFLANPAAYLRAPPGPADRPSDRVVAWFSMEVALDPRMPTYAGGLGVLAGDLVRSSADLGLPIVAVTLLHRRGYFRQRLDGDGGQIEQPAVWEPAHLARKLDAVVKVEAAGRAIAVAAWQFDVDGIGGERVPVILLDTDLPENAPEDRALTDWLYGGDDRYRLLQETILGIGGVRMLRALGYTEIRKWHMNEGHSALLAVELLRERQAQFGGEWDFDGVRNRCLFTTHTPVPAGHDQFDYGLVRELLDDIVPLPILQMLAGSDRLNMTRLALALVHYVNGVARRHGAVSQGMFPTHPIDSITNGVHSRTWTSEPFQRLFDKRIPGWSRDPTSLRYAMAVPRGEIRAAHREAKEKLLLAIERRAPGRLDPDALTIGFARRFTPYKRADLVLRDPARLARIASHVGRLQIVYAGKAHPKDEPGKQILRKVVATARELGSEVPVIVLEDYDLELARVLVAGVDLWLNTPLPPFEASGTSGMKAAHNGVPQLSVLDGWWIEGHIEGVTGWSIGPGPQDPVSGQERERLELDDLYGKLESIIVPMFRDEEDRWTDVMRGAIAFNGSFFNSHRMAWQYAANAWL